MSCGLGPTDEDPEPGFDVRLVRQVGIRPMGKEVGGGKGKEKERTMGEGEEERGDDEEYVCEHQFHAACLVSAERVAGWGEGVDVKEEKEGEEDVEVSCPACRAVGCIAKMDWDEGAVSLA